MAISPRKCPPGSEASLSQLQMKHSQRRWPKTSHTSQRAAFVIRLIKGGGKEWWPGSPGVTALYSSACLVLHEVIEINCIQESVWPAMIVLPKPSTVPSPRVSPSFYNMSAKTSSSTGYASHYHQQQQQQQQQQPQQQQQQQQQPPPPPPQEDQQLQYQYHQQPTLKEQLSPSQRLEPPPQSAMPCLIERLPNELQRMIFSNLDYQALIHLSTMNRYFNRTVDPQRMADSADKAQFVMRAAKDFPQHRPSEKGHDYKPGNFECYICFRVRAPDHFDMLQPQSAYLDRYGRVVRDREPNPQTDKLVSLRRFCVGCGTSGFAGADEFGPSLGACVALTAKETALFARGERWRRTNIELKPFNDISIDNNSLYSAWDSFELANSLDDDGFATWNNPWADCWATAEPAKGQENCSPSLDASVTLAEQEGSESNVRVQNLSLSENHRFPSDRETDETTKTSPLRPVLKQSTGYYYENEFFKVDRSKIAGYGAFAVRELKLGDNILKEIPLFVADSSTVYRQYGKLDAKAQAVATSLFGGNGKIETPKIKRVWDNNCFTLGGNMAGLFPIAARFNHACHPANNIDFRYDHERGYLNMTVRVDKILAGEELRISYGNDRPPDILYSWYGFRCRCGACKGLSDEEFRRLTDQW
ncbi:hypothetical protein PT974_06371 [Cladobotryum mycophilum]|uniref:SET domain-containing protein n=1 Tax=Cladobotryum mycophilum TaxID=491253 RepID=A0ABR0SMK9_9HYPO